MTPLNPPYALSVTAAAKDLEEKYPITQAVKDEMARAHPMHPSCVYAVEDELRFRYRTWHTPDKARCNPKNHHEIPQGMEQWLQGNDMHATAAWAEEVADEAEDTHGAELNDWSDLYHAALLRLVRDTLPTHSVAASEVTADIARLELAYVALSSCHCFCADEAGAVKRKLEQLKRRLDDLNNKDNA